jgi:hypothetical protein
VLIATRNLSAYQALTDSDVSIGFRPAGGQNYYASLPIDGKLTLRPIRKGQPITGEEISPDVVQFLGSNVTVAGLNISRAAALGGTLSSGDRIQILLGGSQQNVKFDAVILSIVERGISPDHELIVAALQTQYAERYGRLLAAGNGVVIVPAVGDSTDSTLSASR